MTELATLSEQQRFSYDRDGFLVLRGAIAEADIQRLERGVERNPPLDGTLDPYAPEYPAPGRYTLATQSLKDPDLAFIVEHPHIVGPVTTILGEPPRLTAYVIYDRTPGGAGLPMHHDYKRWRPVGSSMHWLFTIVPFTDFDELAGPLYVAPGSHRLERVHAGSTCTLEVEPAIRPDAADFIDPELKRGDLLLMNMHLWHKADANRSERHRVGLFNKYAGAYHPPATGYYLFDDDVAAALSADARHLIAVHSNKTINTTRAVLTRIRGDDVQVYVEKTATGLMLPGGEIFHERAIPDWDLGNYIAPLQQHLRERVSIELPWLSYVGDYAEDEGLCRVYGYALNDNGFPVDYHGDWLAFNTINESELAHGYELDAVRSWLDPKYVRGKGLSQAQCRIDQFAY